MNRVGLFVDYENICLTLHQIDEKPTKHETFIKRLIEISQRYGQIVTSISWANWDMFPIAQGLFESYQFETKHIPISPVTSQDTNNDMTIQTEILKSLKNENAPDIFILVTGERDFIYAVEELKRFDRQVVLIAIEDAVPVELKHTAHGFHSLDLNIFDDQPVSNMFQLQQSQHANKNKISFETKMAEATLEQIRQCIVYLVESKSLSWVSYRLLAESIVLHKIVPPEEAHYWIDKAIQEGIILKEEEQGATKRFFKFLPAKQNHLHYQNKHFSHQAHQPVAHHSYNTHHRNEIHKVRGHSQHDSMMDSSHFSYDHHTRNNDHRHQTDMFQSAFSQTSSKASSWSQDWRNFTFVRIIWAIQQYESEKTSHEYLTASILTQILKHYGIGITDEEVFFWINQSVDKEILIREVKEGTPSVSRTYRYALNQNLQLVVFAQEIPKAVVTTVDHVLRIRSDWNGIAFNFLTRLLQVHPYISNPNHDIQPIRLKEWINFLIEFKILMRFEEPDLKDPSHTTTMVGLNKEHPEAKFFITHEPKESFYTPEHQAVLRAILTIDHFLHWLKTKSPGENWLPLMTLKTWLRASLGDQLTKWAILICEQESIFIIDRFQNKTGAEATVAGVRLDYNHPLVSQTLLRRDEFLHILIGLLKNRASVSLQSLEQRLRICDLLGNSTEERTSWIPLMIDTKVVCVDKDLHPEQEFPTELVCKINSREKFVGELITRVIRETHFRDEHNLEEMRQMMKLDFADHPHEAIAYSQNNDTVQEKEPPQMQKEEPREYVSHSLFPTKLPSA